jgi:hypothetical protein
MLQTVPMGKNRNSKTAIVRDRVRAQGLWLRGSYCSVDFYEHVSNDQVGRRGVALTDKMYRHKNEQYRQKLATRRTHRPGHQSCELPGTGPAVIPQTPTVEPNEHPMCTRDLHIPRSFIGRYCQLRSPSRSPGVLDMLPHHRDQISTQFPFGPLISTLFGLPSVALLKQTSPLEFCLK